MRAARETSGRWIGPMDPGTFLAKFLPTGNNSIDRPNFRREDYATILSGSCGSGTEIYRTLIQAFAPFARHLQFVEKYFEIDGYWEGTIANHDSYSTSEGQEVEPTLPDLSRLEIPLDFEHDQSDDPFVDCEETGDATESIKPHFESDNNKHLAIRGKLGLNCSMLFGAQFRVHAFSILICGQWARLLRWDRNGVVVTKKFLYSKEDHLVEFLWRYSQTPAGHPIRGHDPTIRPLCPRNYSQTLEETAARVKLIEANEFHQEFRVMLIPDRDTDKEFEFLISYPPKYKAFSPFGRATRPMLAFDLYKNKVVFVKDYWRSVEDDAEKEGDIYKILHEAKVQHIAPFGRGNYVRQHSTFSDTLSGEGWTCSSAKMVPLRHYRMSLEEVGRRLNEFKSSYELVTAIADAMEAHDLTFYNARILHRDISSSNILITETGRGILIDWDLSVNTNRTIQQADRTGTWEFMSAAVLVDPNRCQDDKDDMESAFYVLTWICMLYLPSNMSKYLNDEMELFDEVSSKGNKGGKLKQHFLMMGVRKLVFDNHPHLNNLIQELALTFSSRYEQLPNPGMLSILNSPALADDPENYVVRERNLRERHWLVKTMRKHLQQQGEWPANDAALLNEVHQPS